MGRLGDLLVRKHSVIATNLFALSVGAGFLYTMRTGQSALSDAKAALSGEAGEGRRASGEGRERWLAGDAGPCAGPGPPALRTCWVSPVGLRLVLGAGSMLAADPPLLPPPPGAPALTAAPTPTPTLPLRQARAPLSSR